MTSTQKDPDIFADMRGVIDNLLLLLSEKERYVVVNRFDLETRGRMTLDSIGKHFSVTRERVRQIEKNALTKLRRNVFNTRLTELQKQIRSVVDMNGGLIKESFLFAHLIGDDSSVDFNKSSSRLAVVLSDDMDLVGNTIDFDPYVSLKYVTPKILKNFSDSVIKFLDKRNNVVMISEIFKEFKKTYSEESWFNVDFLKSLFAINKQIKVLQESIGLIKWRHIHPKTLRDKIFFILRNGQKPLHFVEIANKIAEHNFDVKNVNVQAVHNELIRYNEFVLIGRGIYALSEWGYEHGTTKDVIIALLSKKKVMGETEIVKKVLEKRAVKKITILLALKNGSEFIKVGRKKYQLKK